MYLHSIVIAKFRNISNIQITPITRKINKSEVYVLAGPNGGEKSSILEIIGFTINTSQNWPDAIKRNFEDYSFEVGIGLTDAERDLTISYINGQIAQLKATRSQVISDLNIEERPELRSDLHYNQMEIDSLHQYRNYLYKTNIYYRSHNYHHGEHAKDTQLHDALYSLVGAAMATMPSKPTGLFLKADRAYTKPDVDIDDKQYYDSGRHSSHLINMSFSSSEIQYKDMLTFLIQEQYFHQTSPDTPSPFLKYSNLLNHLFPGYTFATLKGEPSTDLLIKLPSDKIIPFADLSSGEKEVFFLLAFFIRHNISDAIVLLDEPELHLHPNLSHLLISQIKSIGERNQIWIATHSNDIIEETESDHTYFVYTNNDRTTQLTRVDSEPAAKQKLMALLGYSGYIGLKTTIFIEGHKTGLDKQVFSLVFLNKPKFVPIGGSSSIHGINNAILKILEQDIGYVNFFLIRDRDYLSEESVRKFRLKNPGRIFILDRHEIENYLLVPEAISLALIKKFNIHQTSAEIHSILLECAVKMSGNVLRDMVIDRVNRALNVQSFSLTDLSSDVILMHTEVGNILDKQVDVLHRDLISSSMDLTLSITSLLSYESLMQYLTSVKTRLKVHLLAPIG